MSVLPNRTGFVKHSAVTAHFLNIIIRTFFRVYFPQSMTKETLIEMFTETQRDIIANNQQYNNRFNYAVSTFTLFMCCQNTCLEKGSHWLSLFCFQNNFIKTSKYTLLTFLPLNLFEQFQRAANFYFACLLILQVIITNKFSALVISNYIMFQLIPEITSLTPITTALPLFGVLTLTAIKYAYDDVVCLSILCNAHVHSPLLMSV